MKEIVINVDNNENKTIMLVENGNLLEQYEENSQTKRLEGNIYIGKIQNVLQGMQAAFVNIGEKKNTFIHIKDILPKVDTKKDDPEEAVKNNNIKDIVKVGMKVLVQVKRDSTNKKGARVSTHINLAGRFSVIMPEVEFITISQKIEDEKEKKRKEIQQQIKELNSRLRQHQIQMQKEEREKRANAAVTDEKQGSGIKEETKETSVNAQTSVKAILSANTAIDHARKHGNMNLEMEGRVRVLQNEIKQDIQYGKNTEQKQKELEKLEKKAVKVKGAKMSYLASASREMKRAAETEKEADRTFKKKKQAEFVNPAAAPGNFSANRKTNIYIQGNMFSHVDFHF